MRIRIRKLVLGLALAATALALLLFNGLVLWVATGPREINELSAYLEKSLAPADDRFKITIGKTMLIWDGWKHPVDIRLRDIVVLNAEGRVFSRFPEISVGLHVLSLPLGRLLPTSLTFYRPAISLLQNPDRSIDFGFGETAGDAEPAPSIPLSAAIGVFLGSDDSSNLRKLRYVHITGAGVTIRSKERGVFFKTSDAQIIAKRSHAGLVQIDTRATVSYEGYESSLSSHFSIDKDHPAIIGTLVFGQLQTGTLAALFADNSILRAIRFPADGKCTLEFDMAGNLRQMNFVLDGKQGSIDTDLLAGSLPVEQIHAEGILRNNARDLQLDKFSARLGEMELFASGNVSLGEQGTAIKANASLKNVKVEQLPLLWPPALSPVSREWVTSNISAGYVPQATVAVDIKAGDIEKPLLPREAIDASIVLEKAKIRYLPDHPSVSNVKGALHIDGVSLTAEIEAADYLKATKLSKGHVNIDDLNADNPDIRVDFSAEAPAGDVVHMLGLPRLRHAARLGLDENKIEGSARGTAALKFKFYAARDERGNTTGDGDIEYDVKAELTDVSQPGFMKKFDVSNASGTLSVNNTQLEFNGKGTVNGASASNASVKYLFRPQDGFDTFIDVSASAPVETLPRFGYPQFAFLSGALGVKAQVKIGDKKEHSEAAIDLTQASVAAGQIGWNKPPGQPATLAVEADKQNGVLAIPSLALSGKDIDTKGSLQLSSDMSAIESLALSKLRLGDTDLSKVVYKTIPGGHALTLAGKVLDLGDYMESSDSGDFSFEHFPAVDFSADIGEVRLHKGAAPLRELSGELNCGVSLCNSANIKAYVGDNKPFNFRILRNPKGQRQLSLRAQDAGEFFKALGIIGGMEGGDLTVTGNYDDSTSSSLLKARVDITEYTIKDAPILAKILSLASFTGFFDTLQGKGIRFEKLSAPFTLKNDVFTFENAKTHGPSIGMTAEGTVTLPKFMFDLEGTVVPSYMLNTVVGKVPLIGDMLTGGKDQGVFAARYSVKGTEKEPDVSVNPLSILTPGFLRGLFDIMDKPSKKPEEETESN